MLLTAHFDGKVFVPDSAVNMPVGQEVRVEIMTTNINNPAPSDLLAALAQIPANQDWPKDGAAQHDHYLYGTPKLP